MYRKESFFLSLKNNWKIDFQKRKQENKGNGEL
jgi:hypothetical protein